MTLLPKVKLKAIVSFPASVLDGVGIDVVKQNGNYQFNLDFSDFGAISAIPTSPTSYVLTYDTVTGVYVLVPSQLLGGGVSGIADAPTTGLQYGRQSAGWTPITAGSFTYPKPAAITRPGNDKWADRADVRDWGVVGVAYGGTPVDESTAMRNALHDCPANETLWGIPDKAIFVSDDGAGNQCLQMNRPINLRNIMLSCVDNPGNPLAASSALLSIYPAFGNWNWNCLSIADCMFGTPWAGRFGGAAISITTQPTTDTIRNAVFERLVVQQGGASVGAAFMHTNSNLTSGGMACSIVRDSLLANGVKMIQTGDRNSFMHNYFIGSGSDGSMIDLDFVENLTGDATASMNFQFMHNNCGEMGMIFHSGLFPHIAYNTFEQTRSGFLPNGAAINFEGDNFQIDAPVVENNTLRMLGGVPTGTLTSTACVRFNNVRNGKLKGGNSLLAHVPPVIVTPQAQNIFISRNQALDPSVSVPLMAYSTVIPLANANNCVHEKPRNSRYIDFSVGTSSISAETDNVLGSTGAFTADRVWQLPSVTRCFPGEQFIIQDVGNQLGAHNIVLTCFSGEHFYSAGGPASINLTGNGARCELTANPQFGMWYYKITP